MKAIIAAVLLFPALALAQVPGVMSFQGRLLKADGTPETGSPSIRFAIYAAGEGGDPIWHEDQTVALSNGFYSVKLGAITAFPANLFDGSARWLGVTVGLGTELAPRQYIATVPYAFKAATADSAARATDAVNATNAVNATKAASATNATSADAVSWSGVTGKPSTYPPSTHSHKGLVIGGFTPASSCGSSGCGSCCSAWGDATCANCNAYTATCATGVLRGTFCLSQQ